MTGGDLDLAVLEFGYTGPDQRMATRLDFTVSLARLVEECGYSRFWFTEHHSQNLYIACPEVVIAAVAANTSRIRVGSAGILLNYYSPFKVAEVFHTLTALFPNRIDLGVTRGIGATPEAADLLRDGSPKPADSAAAEALFERKMGDLVTHLGMGHDAERQRTPDLPIPERPDIWLLGTQGWSAGLAAKLGTKIVMGVLDGTPEAVDLARIVADYRDQFRRTASGPPATACISLWGICGETDAEADAMVAKNREKYGRDPFLNFRGSPERCRDTITEIASRFGVREILVTSQCVDGDEQKRMFRLLADAMLPAGPGSAGRMVPAEGFEPPTP